MTEPCAPRTVEQRATAKSGATVIQAARDVITGTVFGGSFVRLKDVWLDPAPVFEAVDVDRFVGRTWLLDPVDKFIRNQRRGYILVQAPAGLGKTTFAAWLARTRGWPCHFTRRRNGRSVSTALRNLASQLIAQYQLGDEFAPSGTLPDTAGEPGWFDGLLRFAAAKAQESGQQLVLVIDGLDEAERYDGDLPLGLPTVLPNGVFMVVTSRVGTDLSALRQPWKTLSIDPSDQRNRNDLREFVLATAATEPLATMLPDHQVSAEDLAQLLVRKCGGVWVYLRYVLDELRYGLRDITALDGLPDDLVSYYVESLILPNDGEMWTSVRLPLLATLAAAAEPLPATTLSELAGLADPSLVRTLCDSALRPFLTVVEELGQPRRYGIYHASLREFIGGAARTHALERTRARGDELAQATTAAHRRITCHYLTLFGGLDEQLPALKRDPDLANADDGYPRRQLPYHLEHAGEAEDLHRLLVAEHLIEDGRIRNAWFAIHDRAGSLDEYLTALQRARRLAEDYTDADHGSLRTPSSSSFALELQYRVMASAVVTLTANVPASLIWRLVTTGVWTVGRALDHARNLHHPGDRAHTLISLLHDVGDREKRRATVQAWEAAQLVTDHEDRAWLLSRLLRHMAGEEHEHVACEALHAVVAIQNSSSQVDIFQRLIPVLSEEKIGEVLRLATMIDNAYDAARLLAALAPVLPERLLADAMAAAQALAEPDDRALALAALGPVHDPELRATVLADVLAAGRVAADPYVRARTLRLVATTMSSPGRVPEEALDAARLIKLAEDRSWEIAALARLVESSLADDVCCEAIDAARRVSGSVVRAETLVGIADLLTPQHAAVAADEAVAAIRAIPGDQERAAAFGAVVDDLPQSAREGVIDEALALVREVGGENRQVLLLNRLAPHLPERLHNEALTIVGEVTDAFQRAEAIGCLAPFLSASLTAKGLSAARTISDEYGRAKVFGALASHLPAPHSEKLCERALNAARQVLDPYFRARALTSLATTVTEPQRAATLFEALAAARADDDDYRPTTLTTVLNALPAAAQPAIVAEAFDAITTAVTDPESRAIAIIRLAPHLSSQQREDLWRAVEAGSLAGTPAYYSVGVLAMLAVFAPVVERDRLFDRALALGCDLPASRDPVQTYIRRFARLARVLPHQAVVEVLAGLHPLDDQLADRDRIVLAAKVAKYARLLPERLLRRTLTIAGAVPQTLNPTPLLGTLAMHLPERLREQALTEAFSPTRETVLARSAVIGHQAFEPRPDLELVRRCLDGLDLDGCLRVLACAMPIVQSMSGIDGLLSCVDTIESVRRWWRTP
ncbi:hypothetical protein Q5425_03195 [Amycolatopsis sp. A133]|uniref:hypothetical protein n=1 Tax=Amycolatopsis sp. A133 TaxID=3064472 RepID=UPI0027F2B79D|nr:hypothetical protein [Amycolatopsis sp. A133]MDQ7802720.1 hypothetical protein [Amycolatopsis sp. A133]